MMRCPKFSLINRTWSEKLNLTGKRICFRFFSVKNGHEALILKHTVESISHLTPELKLRLITPECELWHNKYTNSHFPNDPFWGIYWPGGQALGRYILDNRVLFHQKNVLEIGSGCGACALAAAKSGAQFVLANDIDPVSICAIQINSKLNNLNVHTYEQNVIGNDIDILDMNNEIPQLKWDIVLVGDMFYDSEFSSDPERHALKEIETLENCCSVVKIAEYELLDKEHNGFSSSSVFKIMRT